MKSVFTPLLRRVVLAAVLTMLLQLNPGYSSAATRSSDLMFEPLFGLNFKRSEGTFERAPKEVFQCRGLMEPPRILYVFATTTKGKTRFFYLFGLVEAEKFGTTKTTRFEIENDDGIIVAVSPEGCREVGAGYALSPDKGDREIATREGITEDVTAALLSDAVDNEIKAFGGVQQFLSRLKAAGVKESLLHPQLRAKLAEIRKNRGKTSGLPKSR